MGSAPQLREGLLVTRKQPPRFNHNIFLATVGNGKNRADLSPEANYLFASDAADAVFYIQEGQVTLSILSQEGKPERVIPKISQDTLADEFCKCEQF